MIRRALEQFPAGARRQALAGFALLAILAAPAASRAQASPPPPSDPETLLEEAFFTETALCDPLAAAERYRALLERPELPLRVAALAHLRLGICLDLRDDWEAAERHFRATAERFSSEADAALVARRYLDETPRDPAQFMPPDLIFYAELVEPGEETSFLSNLIRGTPLENPVDYYLLTRPGAESDAAARFPGQPPDSPQLEQLRSILNLNVLKELRKIEGIAFGVRASDRPAWLLVFFPGSSDLSRIIVKTVLPQAMERTAPETVEGTRIFKLRQDPVHVAMDEREEVVLAGAPREMVVEAIRRSRRPRRARRAQGAPGSLAEVDDFRRAQAARAGSMLFAYADREKALDALRAGAPAEERASFDEVKKLLGLDHLRALGATVARVGDDLRITLRSGVDAESHPLWSILRTPALGSSSLRFVHPDSLGFLSTSLMDAGGRWERLRGALDPLIGGLPGEGGSRLRSMLQFLDSELGLDFGRDFLGELRGFTAAVPAEFLGARGLPFYVVLEFRDGDLAAPRVERLLGALARRALGPQARVEFRDEPPRDRLALRSFEPVPAFRVLYAREGNTFVLSPFESLVLKAAEARASGSGALAALLPASASKVLVLRPQAIRRLTGPPQARDLGDALILQLPRAIFWTEESPDGLAVELRIPGAVGVISETLKQLRK